MKSAEDTLAGAVAASVAALDLELSDAAAVKLALVYAQQIDTLADGDRWGLGQLGPSLLRVLQQLGASPWARAEIGKRVHPPPGESELARLRAARRPAPR